MSLRLRTFGLMLLLVPWAAVAGPVEFAFKPPAQPLVRNPFARELWAEVVTPGGRRLRLPAYYAGEGVYAVHARPDEAGCYRLGAVTETTDGGRRESLDVADCGPREVAVKIPSRLPAVGLDPRDPRAFWGSDGRPVVPVGANLAWGQGDPVAFYRAALRDFAAADLNWMRLWMVHWGGLNLDWLPEKDGASPPPGGIDLQVAARWDAILTAAEEQGIYVQLVLQHHGQYTTGENSNWKENPWNAAHPGGFLARPADFFTAPQARRLTMLKYRYIVARWGWSPAIFAWELFNEVHWTDACDKEKDWPAVARWHDEMADFLRSVDVYGHLVTTSTDNLDSPVYAKMDFYQPHLYAADLLAGARELPPHTAPARPAFYGEVGDDHLDAPPAVKEAGTFLVPPAWAGLFGVAGFPAQPWDGAALRAQGRLTELGAVSRFVRLSGWAQPGGSLPFTAAVDCGATVPFRLAGVQVWQRRAAPELTVPLDGRVADGLANLPRIYIGWPGSVADGFPDHATVHFDLPRDSTFRARIVGVGRGGPAAIRFLLDGTTVAEKTWEKDVSDRPTPENPLELSFPVKAGRHVLVTANPGGTDWVDVEGIDFGLPIPALAALGRRNDRFIALWVWNRVDIYALQPPSAMAGVVLIPEVPAGTWTVTWWDTQAGRPAGEARSLCHPGGLLRLPTPPFVRHAAVVLTR